VGLFGARVALMGQGIGLAHDLHGQVDQLAGQAGGGMLGMGVQVARHEQPGEVRLELAGAAQHQGNGHLDARVHLAHVLLQLDALMDLGAVDCGEHIDQPALQRAAQLVAHLLVAQIRRGIGIAQHVIVEAAGQGDTMGIDKPLENGKGLGILADQCLPFAFNKFFIHGARSIRGPAPPATGLQKTGSTGQRDCGLSTSAMRSVIQRSARGLSSLMAWGHWPSGYMAGPMITWIVPGYLAQPSLGQNRPALWAMGSTGRLALTARAAPPRENLPIRPTGTRVPSGNTSTQLPSRRCLSPLLASCLRARLGLLRSMAMGRIRASTQPKKGTSSSSRLSTWLSG